MGIYRQTEKYYLLPESRIIKVISEQYYPYDIEVSTKILKRIAKEYGEIIRELLCLYIEDEEEKEENLLIDDDNWKVYEV